MKTTGISSRADSTVTPRTSEFLELIQHVAAGDEDAVNRWLKMDAELARLPWPVGATRSNAAEPFFTEVSHYLYYGDTALHIAAAGTSPSIAALLVSHGADPRARNRRGAEPLHYAADGDRLEPQARIEMIGYLLSVGADPNALDKSGVSPLHRAVRRRSVAAVRALLDGGADIRKPNKSGSTPLHLAVQNTGASGSGSDDAHWHQAEILKLLLARGADPARKDARGRTPLEATSSTWVRELLAR